MKTSVIGWSKVLAVICVMSASAQSVTAGDINAQQRGDYVSAKKALDQKDFGTFRRLLQDLDDYPLVPFLEYEFLRTHLEETSAAVLQSFIERSHQAVISEQLRNSWLRDLARRREWRTFLSVYRPGIKDADLRCSQLQAQINEAGFDDDLDEPIEALWLVGTNQRAECDPVFAAWKKAGRINPERVWKRIELAMELGQTGLASFLAREYLGPADQLWVQRWQDMHRKPQQELASFPIASAGAHAQTILRYGMARLARLDPDTAMDTAARLSQDESITAADQEYMRRQVGLRAAWQHHPAALRWLGQLAPAADDPLVRQWRVLAALRTQDWDAALRWLKALTHEELGERRWRYWQARLLAKSGDETGAQIIFRDLAGLRDYYGFLAADQIDHPYTMGHTALEPHPDEIQALGERLDITMAKELYRVRDTASARRQWAWATRNMDETELRVAAALAHRWQWHDRAIVTVAQAGYWDDLELRFPLLHRDLIETASSSQHLNPAWIFGVVRQESAFVTDARSPAGALGLMQVMPDTARAVGRELNLKIGSTQDMLQAGNNIRLGSRYLRTVLDKHGGNPVLATASYNAGPRRVLEWLPEYGTLDADVWVETIPFTETRSFVKNVLAFSAVYDYRLGKKPTRLRERMPAVAAPG